MTSKQREELQRISAAITVNSLPNEVRTIVCKISLEEVKHIVDTILADPLRNCDVGTACEQVERFQWFCDTRPCDMCTFKNKVNETLDCAIHWVQMPYEEGEQK